jgi:quercetin dioxygenase-like cupin family protein
VQFFRVGPEEKRVRRNDVLLGVAAGPARAVAWHKALSLRIPSGPSGLYFARLTTPDGRLGYAVYVLRPRRLGTSRVAIVEPTNTWQAYNFRDDDHDGRGDTWYAGSDIDHVRLDRPFLARGVPPHFTAYDLPFLQWLEKTGKQADFVVLAQDPVKVAPTHYTLVLENARVRVLKIAYAPGSNSAMHQHPDAIVIPLAASKVRFATPDGKSQDSELASESALYTPATTHTATNLGTGPVEAILVEFKGAAPGKATRAA